MKKNNSLYPSTLFHFTEKQWLFEILKNNFRISYAREKITAPNNETEFAVPMVSFCDIKLAEIKYFIQKGYRNFGIGLTKEWANRNGLNPVLYLNKDSNIADNLIEGVEGMYNHIDRLNDFEEITEITKHYNSLMNMYRYVKNYEGKLIRNGRLKDKNYRYADEREWRYVPPIEKNGIQPFVNILRIKTKKKNITIEYHIFD